MSLSTAVARRPILWFLVVKGAAKLFVPAFQGNAISLNVPSADVADVSRYVQSIEAYLASRKYSIRADVKTGEAYTVTPSVKHPGTFVLNAFVTPTLDTIAI